MICCGYAFLSLDEPFDVNYQGPCRDVAHGDGLACECFDKDLADDGVRDVTFRGEPGLLCARWIHWLRWVLIVVRVVVIQRHDEEVLSFIQKMCNVLELSGVAAHFKTHSSGTGYCKR